MRRQPGATFQAQQKDGQQQQQNTSTSVQQRDDGDRAGSEDTFSDDESDGDDIAAAQDQPDFYDSQEDERDHAWIQKQRQGRQSDAILSCPGCLTTVCIDCQRHEYITTQYRAMFVTNCRYYLCSRVCLMKNTATAAHCLLQGEHNSKAQHSQQQTENKWQEAARLTLSTFKCIEQARRSFYRVLSEL